MKNKEKKKISDLTDTDKNWVIAFWVLLIGVFLLFLAWAKRQVFSERLLKSKLAEQYGVSTKVLVNWLRQLGSNELRMKYTGNKSKEVLADELYPLLGRPTDWPRDAKGRRISNRKEITRTLFIEDSTLNRRLREIEDTEKTIGMTYEAFGRLRQLPPRQAGLIMSYMASQGYVPK